jgi:hypothetical protein
MGRPRFDRPSGTKMGLECALSPAMNRWAIVNRPYGTKNGLECVLSPAMNRWAIVNRPYGSCTIDPTGRNRRGYRGPLLTQRD